MIKFNSIYTTNSEIENIKNTIINNVDYNNEILNYLDFYNTKIFLVHSCTAALEISALALDILPGDEIIMPSYTYVSTGNAFALRGASIVYVDVDENMNIDLEAVELAITNKTKVIVPVHYGGISCNMDKLLDIVKEKNIHIVEDAAQAICSKYKNKFLGTIGDIGCISLHETKNITSKGGGLLLVNNKDLISKVEKIIEKGTNKIQYLNNEVSKYTWNSIGSAYAMSDLNKAFFFAQLKRKDKIIKRRIEIYNKYKNGLIELIDNKFIEVMSIPDDNIINGHMFYIKLKNEDIRNNIINFLKLKQIQTATHYEPLHLSKKGKEVGEFRFKDIRTSCDAKRLLRLPLHLNLDNIEIEYIIRSIKEFFYE